MLSLLRALWGCWHDWDKWQYKKLVIRGQGERPCMERTCKKCGDQETKIARLTDE